VRWSRVPMHGPQGVGSLVTRTNAWTPWGERIGHASQRMASTGWMPSPPLPQHRDASGGKRARRGYRLGRSALASHTSCSPSRSTPPRGAPASAKGWGTCALCRTGCALGEGHARIVAPRRAGALRGAPRGPSIAPSEQRSASEAGDAAAIATTTSERAASGAIPSSLVEDLRGATRGDCDA
jgi:hypothetical protein